MIRTFSFDTQQQLAHAQQQQLAHAQQQLVQAEQNLVREWNHAQRICDDASRLYAKLAATQETLAHAKQQLAKTERKLASIARLANTANCQAEGYTQQEQLARIAEISSSQQEHSQEQPADIRRLIQQHENIYHAS